MNLLTPPPFDQEDDEMLVPHTDFADDPQPLEGVESTDKNTNAKKETTFGNLTNAPFGGTSPATENTGNSIFGLNGSTSNANSQSLGGTSSIISSTGCGIFGFSEVNEEPGVKLQETVITNSVEAQKQDITIGSNPIDSTNGTSFGQLEQILKQKTFSRYEIDSLTELLHSRIGDFPVEDEEKRTPDTFTESHRLLESVSTPVRVGKHAHSSSCKIDDLALLSTTGEGSYEVGGIGGRGGGGKFQKRPFQRPRTTPYDRPPNALKNPRNGWLSKVINPAFRLITASTNRFFNYAFGKQLPKPTLPPPSGVNEEPGDKVQETVVTLVIKNSAEAQKQDIAIGINPINSTDGSSKCFTVNAATAANASTPATGSTTSDSSNLSVSIAAPVLATSGVESTNKDTNTKKETTFGDLTNTSPTTANMGNSIFGLNGSTSNTNNQSLGGTSSIISSTGSGIFGFSGTSSSTANNQTLGPITFGGSSGSLVSARISSSPVGTGFASTSQSMPTQFGLPTASSSFGMTGAAPLNSSNSLFGSLTPSKLFRSSSSGLSSSVSLREASISITSSSNWETTESPIFGSTSTPGFPFGGSGSSGLVAPMVFGASTSASPASKFSFFSRFQCSSSLQFNAAGSFFSLGTGGGDKSNRRMMKVKSQRKN